MCIILISFIRNGEAVDGALLKSLLRMLADLQVYTMTISIFIMCIKIEMTYDTEILAFTYNENCLLKLFFCFQMYQDVFEERFLQATDLLYSAEGQRFMGEVDVPNYLKHVDKRLKEESDRLLHYLDIGTRKPLILCVENQLISKHITNILNKGFESLMDTNSSEHLNVMYALFSRVKDGQDKLCEYFGGYVKVI